jgi:hypothetical protein
MASGRCGAHPSLDFDACAGMFTSAREFLKIPGIN